MIDTAIFVEIWRGPVKRYSSCQNALVVVFTESSQHGGFFLVMMQTPWREATRVNMQRVLRVVWICCRVQHAATVIISIVVSRNTDWKAELLYSVLQNFLMNRISSLLANVSRFGCVQVVDDTKSSYHS